MILKWTFLLKIIVGDKNSIFSKICSNAALKSGIWKTASLFVGAQIAESNTNTIMLKIFVVKILGFAMGHI